MVEEEHKTLTEAFIKVLTSIKLSPLDVLKPKKGMDSWYKLQGIPDKEGDDTHLEYLLNFWVL